jgi:fucose 4-O-acetylase-like acetyltransferase
MQQIGIKRQNWVDIVKGFAITLVVLGHINYGYPHLQLVPVPYIYSWHIRVFFLVAGFFLVTENLERPRSFIKGKFRKLYLPLMYLYIPAALLRNFLFDIGWYSSDVLYGGRTLARFFGGAEYIENVCKTVFFMGSEPIVGALWFAYVLFLCLCLVSFTAWLGRKIFKDSAERREHFVIIVLLLIAIGSSIASIHYNLTIPRLSLVLTYAWLVYCGKLVHNKFKIRFDSRFAFCVCSIGLYSIAVQRKVVNMDEGQLEIISMTFSSVFALYILAYIAKKCKGKSASFFALIGRESFYIMGLHFVAFKLCQYVLMLFGIQQSLAEHAPACPNIWLLLFYLSGGVLLPVGAILIWRQSTGMLKCFFKK